MTPNRPCQCWIITLVLALLDFIHFAHQVDFITELAAYRNRRSFKSRLESLFPTEYSGRCITSPKSGRDICYPDISMLDYSCVSKNHQGHKSIPPPRITHGQYKALITKFRPHSFNPRVNSSYEEGQSSFKPFLVVQYECHTGYDFLDEAEFLFCREYSWHQTVPVCVPSNFIAEYRGRANPCQDNNGGCSHVCKHVSEKVVRCECPKNWELQDDKKTCLELDLCQVNNGGCSHFCEIQDSIGRCSCPDGFILRSDEKTCVEEMHQISDFLPEKLGICPQVEFGHPDQKCASYCRRDHDCTGKAKCCTNGCANVCLDPEPGSDLITRPITECTSTDGCRCVVLDESKQRCQCPQGIVCHLTRSPPEVSVLPAGQIEIRPGAPLNLTCTAVGFPYSNLTWYKDGVIMEQQEKTGGQYDKTTTKRLLIKELFKSTVFSCEAVNDVGGSIVDVEVLVTGPGSPPINIQAKTSGTSVTIRWLPPTLPNGRMKGYQVYYMAKDVRKPLRYWKTMGAAEPRVTLDNLEPETRYFFRVMPYNERGSGIMTNVFSVKTEKQDVPPVINITEGSNIELEPGEGANLTCIVLDGFPAPQLAWYQHGNRLQEPTVTKKLIYVVENALESTSFECRSSNSKGAANITVKIDVLGPGGAPGQIQYRVDGTNVELSWGSPQFPNGVIKGYIIYYTADHKLPLENWDVEMVHGRQATILKELRPLTTYYLRFKAFNEKGAGPLSDVLSATTNLKNEPPKVRVVDPTGPLHVAPFGNVNLTCAASGVPEPAITWKQDGEILRSFGKPGPAANETAKSIFIQRLVENTAFTCEASNHVGTDSLRIDVVVTGPGSPPENIELNVYETTMHLQWQEPFITNGVITGYNVYYSTNQSLPMAQWHKLTIASSARQSNATINDLEEEAVYFVRIAGLTNLGEGVPSQPHQAATQRKTYAPEATLTPSESKVSLRFDQEYAVTCTADGYPQPKLVWHRDGQPVGFRAITDDVKSISAVLTVENLLTSSLFQCKADNDLGSSMKEVFIEIVGPGSPPAKVKYLPYSTNIDLQWDVPEIPNGEIKGYEIIYTINPEEHINKWSKVITDNQREYKLMGLAPDIPYIIQIRAINDKGPGPWTPPFGVTTGRAESAPVITLNPEGPLLAVEPGSSVNLTCSAEGFPEPTVSWFEGNNPISIDSGSEITIMKENILEPTTFECKATNLFGVVSKTVMVDVTGPGEPPLRFLCDTKGLSVHLSWLPPRIKNGNLQSFIIHYSTDPNADISTWETIHVPAKPQDSKTQFYDITLSNLPPLTTFYFKARAISDKGIGVLSKPISVTTEEKDYFINSTVAPSETVEVPLNGGLEVNCTAQGYPIPIVTFRKNDKPLVEPKPYSNALFLDNISGPVSLECYASSLAGTSIKTLHIFPSEKIEMACRPTAALIDGHFVINWKDAVGTFKNGSNFSILYTNTNDLPLNLWSSLETKDPTQIYFPNLVPGQKYYIRMKVTFPGGQHFIICDSTAVSPPTLPKQVTIKRATNRTVLVWGKLNIPDKKIEKVYVYYTYEINKPMDQWEKIMVSPTAEEIALSDVKPSTDYLIKLEFVTDQGEKIYSLQYEIKSPDFEYTKCEMAKCDHHCTYNETADLALCSCHKGFILSKADNRTCTEFGPKSSCSIENGGCEQICTQTIVPETEDASETEVDDFVACSCLPGYTIQDDKVSCLIASTPSTTTGIPSEAEICLLPMEIGSCTDNTPAWYYDAEFDSCNVFTYTGCGGNLNRFDSRSQCMDICSGKKCHQYRKKAIKEQKPYLPACDETTGGFLPLQCDIFNECWCTDPETGIEINGSRQKSDVGKPYCSACEFDQHRLLSIADGQSFIPSCSEEGHYSLVQCDSRTGQCWCVDQMTGVEIGNSRVPSGTTVVCQQPPDTTTPNDFRVALAEGDRVKFAYKLPKDTKAKKFILYYTPDVVTPEKSPKWLAVEVDKNFLEDGFERPNFLKPNSTYFFKLAPLVDAGLGEPSNIVQLSSVPNVPPQPAQIRAEKLVPNDVVIAWNRTPSIDGPNPAHYNVYITDLKQGLEQILPDTLAYDRINLDLKPNTNYSVSIAAIGPVGPGPKTRVIKFKTSPAQDIFSSSPKPELNTIGGNTLTPTTDEISRVTMNQSFYSSTGDTWKLLTDFPDIKGTIDQDATSPRLFIPSEITIEPGSATENPVSEELGTKSTSEAQYEVITDKPSDPIHHGAYQLKSLMNDTSFKPWSKALDTCQDMSPLEATDLVFVVDMSEHRDRRDYDQVLTSLISLITLLLDYKLSNGVERVFKTAFVHVAEAIETPVTLGVYDHDTIQLTSILRNTDHLKGGSSARIPEAIYEARDVLSEPGSRVYAQKLVLFITDGNFHPVDTKSAIRELTNQGIRFVVVGIGDGSASVQDLVPMDKNVFLSPNAHYFNENLAPSILKSICSLQSSKSHVPQYQIAPDRINITKGQFSTENEMEIEWAVENLPSDLRGFEVTYVNVKGNTEQTILVNAGVRALTLSDIPPQDHIILVKASTLNETVTSKPFRIQHKLDKATVSTIIVPGEVTVNRGAESTPTPSKKPPGAHIGESTPEGNQGSGQLVTLQEVTDELLSSTPSGAQDFLVTTPTTEDYVSPVTPYSIFSSSIPPGQIQVAPKCNCTCQILIKIKRGNCFYEDDTDSSTNQQEITIDLDQILRGKQGQNSNCTRIHDVLVPTIGGTTDQNNEIDRHVHPVPKEKESECPCVLPVYGETCPPGFSFKSGKCRDINECAYINGGCSHGCVNTVGSYYCACPPGMYRDLGNPKRCMDQDNYFRRLGQLLHHHLWNEVKNNGSNGIGAGFSGRLSNTTNSLKVEWEWSQEKLKRRRKL